MCKLRRPKAEGDINFSHGIYAISHDMRVVYAVNGIQNDCHRPLPW